jgi:hypothetical protein
MRKATLPQNHSASISAVARAVTFALGFAIAAGYSSPANSSAPAAAARGWEPSRTWVFVVGTLQWKDSATLASFDPKNRRDAELVEFFRGQGVPAAQLSYLQDKQATTARIQSALKKMLAKTRTGDLLFLYYCGHGYKDDTGRAFFASYDADEKTAGWAMDSIPTRIQADFKGARALLAADCCYSGALAGHVQKAAGRVSFGVLTSSSASQLSTGNWTFTESLLDGLRGHAGSDLNNDGRVTFADLGAYIVADMAWGEEQRATSTTAGAFDPQTILARAPAKPDPRVGQRVHAREDGKYYTARITDARPGGFKIHWLGFRDYEDVWVKAAHVRFPKAKAGPKFAIGSSVQVKWKGKWYPAKILQEKDGVYLIHYARYSAEWDEWVGPKRIRARP